MTVSNTNGAYTIDPQQVITYAPEALRSFFVYGFEWIDNFHFLQEPFTFLGARAVMYESAAKERFNEAGWEGDGDVNLLWLPPFVFPLEMRVPPAGVVVWHVKQVADGVSFLLSPIALPFPEFDGG